jgi:hypothetical protein
MDVETEALATIRQRAQRALSRSRLASDPDLKREWIAIADDWMAILATLEQIDRRPRPAANQKRRR